MAREEAWRWECKWHIWRIVRRPVGLSPENDGERVGTEPRAVVEAKLWSFSGHAKYLVFCLLLFFILKAMTLPRINMLCCWEHQVLSLLGKALSTGIYNGTSYQDGWLTFTPGWGETTQFPLGSHCPTANWPCGNTLYLEWNMHHLKKGEVVGRYLLYSSPVIASCLTVLSPPANMYGTHN